MVCGNISINGGYNDYVFDDVRPSVVCLTGGGKSLKQMTKVEIYTIAKSMDIKGRSTMTKADLYNAVRRVALSRKAKASSSRKAKSFKKASQKNLSKKASQK
jgi:hypothetical protein